MSKDRVITIVSKPTIAIVAFAVLTCLHAIVPATAKPMSRCQAKHSLCTERCLMKASTEGAGSACIARTCDRQNPGCGPESYEPGMTGPKGKGRAGRLAPPSAGKAGQVRTPPNGGILQTNSGLPGRGPAGTGVPRPPKSGGVIIN